VQAPFKKTSFLNLAGHCRYLWCGWHCAFPVSFKPSLGRRRKHWLFKLLLQRMAGCYVLGSCV